MAEDDQSGVRVKHRDLNAGGPRSSTANIDVLQIVVESSPPSDTTKITFSESSATADATNVIDEFDHKADSFSSTAAHLLVMVMALDPSQIKHHPAISSILRVLACWQDASDSKDLATKWVKWLAEAMPHLSRTASAELHGRAIRRLRQLGRGGLVMPSDWVLPNDSIPMPEWCEPHPHQQYLIEEDVWLCDYRPQAGHPLMKVVVKGCGGEYALPQRLAEARFAESIVTKSLIHPNIVTFLGILQDWRCWSSLSSYRLPIKYELALVSEYLPFSGVLAYLERVPSETTASRIGLIRDLWQAITYMHERGLVHGDIKSANFWIGSDHVGRLGDMGTCHLLDITTPGQVTLATFALEGTHDYIPPEILSQDREINRRAATTVDVYGFSITAWEILSGKRAYAGIRRGPALIRSIVSGTRPSPRPDSIGEEAYDGLWELIQQGWSSDPTKRPALESFATHLANMGRNSPSLAAGILD